MHRLRTLAALCAMAAIVVAMVAAVDHHAGATVSATTPAGAHLVRAEADLDAEVATNRIAGSSRYGTSGLLARRICGAYATGYLASAVADSTRLQVYVASGAGFADGLAVSGNLGLTGPQVRYPNRSDDRLTGLLAGPGPLVLTNPTQVRADTIEALDAIASTCGIGRITIIGGTGAVSSQVETELRERYGSVDRLGGRDRYATAIALAARLALERSRPEIREVLGRLDSAIITTGRSFADAIAAGVLATRSRVPVLLNDGPLLRSDVAAFVRDNSIRQVLIVGGLAAVPSTIDAELQRLGATVTRVAGRNRFDTSAQLADRGFPRPLEITLANGYEFADALSATPFAAIHAAPMLLTDANRLPDWVTIYLARRATTTGRIWVIGGQGVVSDQVVNSAQTAWST